MENVIKNNFCKYCKTNRKDCIKIKSQIKNNVLTYKCENYKSNIQYEEYMKYIICDYHDENFNHIVIIKYKTPIDIILQLRKKYDYVKSRKNDIDY